MCISNDTEQLLDTLGADRRDNAKLGKMGKNGIYHRSLLAAEEMARAVEHQAALLLRCLGRDEPHVRPGDRFADDVGARQLRAFWKSQGNLAVRKSAWWGWKDSNVRTDGY